MGSGWEAIGSRRQGMRDGRSSRVSAPDRVARHNEAYRSRDQIRSRRIKPGLRRTCGQPRSTEPMIVFSGQECEHEFCRVFSATGSGTRVGRLESRVQSRRGVDGSREASLALGPCRVALNRGCPSPALSGTLSPAREIGAVIGGWGEGNEDGGGDGSWEAPTAVRPCIMPMNRRERSTSNAQRPMGNHQPVHGKHLYRPAAGV
jgi:hypothetical protein